MTKRGASRNASELSVRLRIAHKGGAKLEELVNMSGGLSAAQVLYRVHPPERTHERVYCRKANLLMDAEMHDRLMEHANRQRTSPAEVMRTFIEWGLEQCA